MTGRNAWIISDGAGFMVFTNRSAVWDHIKLNTNILTDYNTRIDITGYNEKTEKQLRAAFIKAIGERQVSIDQYSTDRSWDGEQMVEEEWIDYHVALITPAGIHSKGFKEAHSL